MRDLRLPKFYYKVIILVTWLFSITTLQAQTQPIQINGPLNSGELVGHIEYYLDDTGDLDIDTVSKSSFDEKFEAVDLEFINFGFTKSIIWLKFSLENTSEAESRFLIYVRENFFQIFEAYQNDANGQIVTITQQNDTTNFGERPIQFPFLVFPVEAESGKTRDVYIRYFSGGSSEMRFTIETEESFGKISNNSIFKNSMFYGMLALLFIVSASAYIFSFRPVFFAYAASMLMNLLLLMHLDGTAFQFIWPDWPQINGDASLYVGVLSLFFGSMYGREFLQTRRYHLIADWVFIAIMVFCTLVLLASAVVDTQLLKWVMIVLAPFTYLWFLLAGLIAGHSRFKEVRFYVLAWVGVVISSIGLTMREILGFQLSEELQWDSVRFVMVCHAAFMGMGLLDRINQIRLASRRNLKASLKQAQQNLVLTQRLNDLETQVETILKLNETKDAEIINTVHDLRQPLHTLRLKVHEIMRDDGDNSKGFDDLMQNFSYLENLISKQLEEAAETSLILSSGETVLFRDESEDEENRETLSTDAILTSVYEMFRSDAEDKGLQLEYNRTEHEVDIDNLVLMRIVSNLVSNAIKYTQEGKVRFGLVKKGSRLRFEVQDTGVGMSSEQFEAALGHSVRLKEGADQAEGNGLGLSIIKDLAEKHGLEFFLNPASGQGTGICVDFPAKMA